MHILIIEDDRELCDALQLQLLARNHTADCCYTGSDALYFVLNGAYDLILLDRMLPEVDGMTVLRSLRQNHIDTPVILTTALGTLDDRINGLDCGADDYLVKPYAIEELMARIRALARRPHSLSDRRCLAFLDIQLDPDTRVLSCNGKELQLSKRKSFLLEYFLRNPEKTLARDQIFSRVWGIDGTVESANLDTYVYFLRKHLRSLKSRVSITTVHGTGYRLEEKPDYVS